MAEKTLKDAFYEMLKDVYWAERTSARSMKKLAKSAQGQALRQAMDEHAEESAHHVERLQQVFETLGKGARSKTCEAMQGILSEATEDQDDFGGSAANDDMVIASAQAVEHYEIARYGTLKAWAGKLGMQEAADLLGQTLEEEKRADTRLSEVAERNAATGADKEPDEDGEDEEEPAPAAKRRRAG